MRNSPTLGSWICLPLHSRRPHGDRSIELLFRRSYARHLLRGCPLPLCPFNGSSLRYLCRIRSLIPSIHRINPSPSLNEVPLLSNVPWGKPHLLPATLPWSSRNATTILGLSRRLHHLKRSFLCWVNNFSSISRYFPSNPMGSLRGPALNSSAGFHPNLGGMAPRTSSGAPHLRRTPHSFPTLTIEGQGESNSLQNGFKPNA